MKFTAAGTATAVHALGGSGITSYALNECYPNPFNPATTISYELPAKNRVTLKVYDVRGREVAKLVEAEQSAGYHSLTWNASHLSSGVYFARLTPRGLRRDAQGALDQMTWKVAPRTPTEDVGTSWGKEDLPPADFWCGLNENNKA